MLSLQKFRRWWKRGCENAIVFLEKSDEPFIVAVRVSP